MANRNDYIILNKKLDRYAKILEDNLGVNLGEDEVERRRLGFYIYILEQVCNESDVCTLAESVIDTAFNRKVFERTVNDCGVDAIFVNEETKELKLFNFKYRKDFKPGNTQRLNDSFMSTEGVQISVSRSLTDRCRLRVCPQNGLITETASNSNFVSGVTTAFEPSISRHRAV